MTNMKAVSCHRTGRIECRFCIKCLLLSGITLILFVLYIIPQKSSHQSTFIQFYVYTEDAQLNLTLSRAQARSSNNSNQTHIRGFPKILHHEFESLDGKPLTPEWKLARHSCIDNTPGFTHMLWNSTTLRIFLAQHYSWFLPTYDSYKYTIERLDASRYFLLYHYGGMYIDMDITCRISVPTLFQTFPNGTHVVLSASHPAHEVTNSLIIAQAGHSLFYDVIHHLAESKVDYLFPYASIMFSTGPRYLSSRYYKFLLANRDRAIEGGRGPLDGVFVLQVKFYNQLFGHHNSGAWHRWDAKLILFFYQLIPSFVLNLFF